MLGDVAIKRLARQVSEIESDDVRQAYLRFAISLNGPRGLVLQPDSHGFIEKESRFYCGSEWYFSAVLNKSWVLFYFRNPAIRDGFVDHDAVSTVFSEAEPTKARDYKLRVFDLASASKVCEFILRAA